MVRIIPVLTVNAHTFDYVPPRRRNSEHTRDSFRGKCPMIVPSFSQPQLIDRKRFRACTPTPLQLPPPILLYIACLSLHARAARKPITLY